MSESIPFNQLCSTGKETDYIHDAMARGKISGNGYYTQLCQQFFERRYGFKKTFLTTSCTDALEMAALLLDIKPGDEVIAPSYTFVSTVNAFALRGAHLVFADSEAGHPNIDLGHIEQLITPKTKAIVVVHYAGMSVDMHALVSLCQQYQIPLVEDAAQAVDSYYDGKPLGSFGTFGTYSFHDTKNITCGEGGLLIVNNEQYIKHAEQIWEKGTNRADYMRGEVNQYGWVSIGSSFLPSELNAAYLYAQLEAIDTIQNNRKESWNRYDELLQPLANQGKISLPKVNELSEHNAHIYYLVCESEAIRNQLISSLKLAGIQTAFHYQSLHKSTFFKGQYQGKELVNADKFTSRLLRLPMFYGLSNQQQMVIVQHINRFFEINKIVL